LSYGCIFSSASRISPGNRRRVTMRLGRSVARKSRKMDQNPAAANRLNPPSLSGDLPAALRAAMRAGVLAAVQERGEPPGEGAGGGPGKRRANPQLLDSRVEMSNVAAPFKTELEKPAANRQPLTQKTPHRSWHPTLHE